MHRVWFCKANFNKMPVERQVKVNIEAGRGNWSGWGARHATHTDLETVLRPF